METLSTIEIRTARLLLRDFREDDSVDYVALRSDPGFGRFHPVDERTAAATEELLHGFLRGAAERPRTRFQAAIETAAGELAGSCGVRIASPGGREASFGCELGRAWWGRGYALEAGQAMLELGFATLGLHRIFAETLAQNRPAVALGHRLGMRPEAVTGETREFDGRRWDTMVLSIRRSEWEAGPIRSTGRPDGASPAKPDAGAPA